MANVYSDNKYIAIGVIGSLIVLYGHSQSLPQSYYIIGSLALLVTAVHYKLIYFIALELILIAGHLSILLHINPNIQIALPILLCVQLSIFYMMLGKENSILLLIGIIGIALLSLGFGSAYNNQWVLFSGSSFIAIYAYYSAYKICYASYIWAALNTLFAGIGFYKLFF